MNKCLREPRRRARRATIRKQAAVRRETVPDGPLDAELARKVDAWWRAANYLSVGQTYLYDNPLLRQPLKKEHVKPRLV